MIKLRELLAVSFRAKMLGPVIAVMVLLFAFTAWVVSKRLTNQVRTEATQTLVAADEIFRTLQKDRMETMMLRFHDLPKQPYYTAAFYTRETVALRRALDTLLAQRGVDVVLFSSTAQKLLASAARDPLTSVPSFESASAAAIKQALQREETADTVRVDARLYDVVCVPVFDQYDNFIGVLTIGSEITAAAAEKLSRLTHTQVTLVTTNQVIASRFATPEAKTQFVSLFNQISSGPGKTNSAAVMRDLIIGDESYCSSIGRFSSLNGDESFGYLLLYSTEQPIRAIQATQRILLAFSAFAILAGIAAVALVIGRVTRPLRELRNNAEAVGRGDFTRRVVVESQDEWGQLARVFNQMTENVKNSRDQLEMTVETLKTTQAQLIQSEKLSGIGEFIAGVAHELNNPLTSVMGFSELLKQAEVDPKYKRYMDMIHKSALRCQKIVQALLSFARRRAPERKPACLNGLIEAAIEILQYQLRTSNIEMITRLDPHLPQAMVDPHQIQQVFVNLINNSRQAIEAHQPKGWIKVTTVTQGDAVRVIFQDNGPGISSDHLSKIFDPFFTTKDVGQGTGLGLSLCYGIIKEHGGTITPCSKPGEGAVFIIELPITHEAMDAPEEPAPSAETEPVNPREGEGRKVLVVDDEEPILNMVREVLMPRGYEVDIAPDGETGLKQSTRKKYDVMLCDWKMPGLNGKQVYERLRATNPTLSDRMIFITGDLISDRTRKFLEQQNKICLPKPFTLVEFRSAITKVLNAGDRETQAKAAEAPAKLPAVTEGKSKKRERDSAAGEAP